MFEQFQQIERKESFAQLFRNLKIAFVAALAVWFSLMALQISVLDDFFLLNSFYLEESKDWYETLTLNLLLLGYPISAIALWLCKDTFVVERFPIWLNISVVGSIFSMSVQSLMIQILRTENGWIRYTSAGDALIAMFFATLLSFYVAPITAAFYYSPPIVEVIKRNLRKG